MQQKPQRPIKCIWPHWILAVGDILQPCAEIFPYGPLWDLVVLFPAEYFVLGDAPTMLGLIPIHVFDTGSRHVSSHWISYLASVAFGETTAWYKWIVPIWSIHYSDNTGRHVELWLQSLEVIEATRISCMAAHRRSLLDIAISSFHTRQHMNCR